MKKRIITIALIGIVNTAFSQPSPGQEQNFEQHKATILKHLEPLVACIKAAQNENQLLECHGRPMPPPPDQIHPQSR